MVITLHGLTYLHGKYVKLSRMSFIEDYEGDEQMVD